MQHISAIIIEDDEFSAEQLKDLLAKNHNTIQVLQVCSTGEQAKNALLTLSPDIVFLDIELPDMSGFELLKALPNINFEVIFTTAFDQYAINAIRFSALDYLLKPIDEEELSIAISKFKNQFQKNTISSLDFEAIKRMLVNPVEKEYKKRFSVKIAQQLKVISIDEVECFYSENKGTYIHTLDNRDYLIDSTLEVVEAEINPKDFYRVSRKFIVPLKAVKEIQVYSNSRLKIILPTYRDDEVIVARERVGDFKEWIG